MTYYQDISKYYDMLMNAGYYNYEPLAKTVRSVIGQRERVLELGIGTGQLAQLLVEAEPTYDFVGIDFSPAMLEIASKRLPKTVSLIECDVADMKMDRKFDVAFSSGGTWVIVRSSNGLLLGTHLFDKHKDLRGLQNVSNLLEPGGLLVLSVHPPHEDRDITLEDGVVYSQKISKKSGDSDHFFIDKTYSFLKDGNVLAEEMITLGFYQESLFQKMLSDVGFKPLGLTETEDFFVFEKVI
ncbi:MAG: class I SAM-dependent methyltransferase [Cyanobacteria bacterium P01_G01_bin.54]